MSLVNCPNCGQAISEKATVCPNCQNSTNFAIRQIICSECGASYSENLKSCPSCGCPNNTTVVRKNPKKKANGIVKAVIFLFVFLAIVLVCNQNKTISYYNNLTAVSYKMLDGAAKAEEAGNLIKKVWYNSIYEEQDSETDAFTMINDVFVEDFNTALENLFDDTEFNNNINEIKENQSEVMMCPLSSRQTK